MDGSNTAGPGSAQAGAVAKADACSATGVHGWLLVLCVVLAIVGPLITLRLMSDQLILATSFAPHDGLRMALLASLAIKGCLVVFSVYAGLRLWRVQPGAVVTAKHALLFGLASSVISITLRVLADPASVTDGRLVHAVTMGLIPSLIFFTVSYAYLNHSSRVRQTYSTCEARSASSAAS